MDRFSRSTIAVLCAAVALSGSVAAQTARTGGGASTQLMQQMQQLASERTALQAENDKLKKQLLDMTKDRDALKSGQPSLERRAKDASTAAAQSNSQRAATEQSLAQTNAKMQELIGKFRETIVQLRSAETERATAKQMLATRERELAACADHNHALYQINDEILTHMEKKGGFSDPFTRIKRTQLENYVDESHARAQ